MGILGGLSGKHALVFTRDPLRLVRHDSNPVLVGRLKFAALDGIPHVLHILVFERRTLSHVIGPPGVRLFARQIKVKLVTRPDSIANDLNRRLIQF